MSELQNHVLNKVKPSSISWETLTVVETCCSCTINTSGSSTYWGIWQIYNLEFNVQSTRYLRVCFFLLSCLWKVSHIIFVLRLTILLLKCVISSHKSTTDLYIIDCEILCAKNMVECQRITFAVSNYFKYHQYPRQTQTSSIIQLLLILIGSVEINPGPRAPKFPCG